MEISQDSALATRRFARVLGPYMVIVPLAAPGVFTAAILVAGGTSRAWVLLWQGIAIAFWTTVGTVSLWMALQLVIQTA